MRARNIKPGFFKNEALGECSPEARLLFIGLWLLADRKGRLEYRPLRWKAELFPYDQVDMVALCEELTRHGLVMLYEVEGVHYAWIPRFLAHQNPHQNEAGSNISPHPSDHSGKDLLPRSKVLATKGDSAPADSLNPSFLNPDSLKKKSSASASKKCPSIYSSEFKTFWGLYPSRNGQKVKKAKAWESFHKITSNGAGVTPDMLIEAIKILAPTYGDFPRDAVTWLNQKGWQDEVGLQDTGAPALPGTPEFERQLAELRAYQAREASSER